MIRIIIEILLNGLHHWRLTKIDFNCVSTGHRIRFPEALKSPERHTYENKIITAPDNCLVLYLFQEYSEQLVISVA